MVGIRHQGLFLKRVSSMHLYTYLHRQQLTTTLLRGLQSICKSYPVGIAVLFPRIPSRPALVLCVRTELKQRTNHPTETFLRGNSHWGLQMLVTGPVGVCCAASGGLSLGRLDRPGMSPDRSPRI